jgi:hypothetical protein
MGKIVLEMSFNAFSGLHGGLVLFLKDLPKPAKPNRTYMGKIVLEMSFNAFSGLHGGLVLFEKIYLNPRSQIGLIWEKSFWK